MKEALRMIAQGKHLDPEGLAQIKAIHSRMNTKRDRSGFNHGNIQLSANWIRGFIDAEGCFYVGVSPNKTSRLGYRVITSFSVIQTAVERPVLVALQYFFGGIGSIVSRKSGRGKPTFEYRVVGIQDLLTVIIPFFQANPLLTTKKLNFQDPAGPTGTPGSA